MSQMAYAHYISATSRILEYSYSCLPSWSKEERENETGMDKETIYGVTDGVPSV